MPKRTARATTPQDPARTAAATSRDPGQGGNIIVVATDGPLLDLMRAAVQDRHRLWRATSHLQATELLLAAPASVLLLDMAVLESQAAAVIARLHEQFPASPIVVTGRRDDEAALSTLISSGAVYRFLHKPLSEDRARTFLEAGLRRVAEQPPPRPSNAPEAPAEAPPSAPRPRRTGPDLNLRKPGPLALAAALLGVLVGGALLVAGWPWGARTDDAAATATLRPASSLPPAARPAPSATVEPGPAPAAPDPALAERLAEAERALAEGRVAEPAGDNAIEHYRAALSLDPANEAARAGLERATGLLLEQADAALLAGNLAAAATALDAARAASPQHRAIADVSAKLAAQRSRLVAPGRPAVAVAPGAADPPQAAPARTEREARFERALGGAREAIARGQPVEAAAWIARAAELDVDRVAVERVQAQLDALRAATERAERSRLLALANQRIAQGRLTEPPGDSALHYLDLLRAADPGFGGLEETLALFEERQAAGTRPAPAPAAAAPAASARQAPAASSPTELVRVAYTPPVYPTRAAARGIEGWVDVEFTVGRDGRVRDARVADASAPGEFDNVALEAVGRWRYEPLPAERRVTQRLRWVLDGR